MSAPNDTAGGAVPDSESEHGDLAHHATRGMTAESGPPGEQGHHGPPSGKPHSGHDGHGQAAHAGRDASEHRGHEALFRSRFVVCSLLSVPVLAYTPMFQDWLQFRSPAFAGSGLLVPTFSTLIFALGGLPFLRMARGELARRQPGMMMLISLAITVAFAYSLYATAIGASGFFWELVTLIDVMLLGHWLEMRSVRQASRALDELAKLLPDTADRVSGDQVETVRVDQLSRGDLVLVRPGASVPADGIVEAGSSEVGEALVTGESRPVQKSAGARVIAGTLNGDGSLRVRVEAIGDQTALAGIMRLVEAAQRSKSATQVLADRAAGWLFYIALAVAAATGVAWAVATGFGATTLERVVTVLVIACPHALGLAVPLVVAITTSLGAQNGILIRDRMALEKARSVDVVLFDKTGTLTRGEHGVVGVATGPERDPRDAVALAAAVEGDSEHVVARALRAHAEHEGVAVPKATNFEALPGRGARATVSGKPLQVGGPRLLESLGVKPDGPVAEFAADAGSKGWTVVYLIEDGAVTAAFGLADVIRPESRAAVDALRQLGLEVSLVTGDSEDVANAVGRSLGITQVFAGILPENKSDTVARLQAAGHTVAMVGDGINDAPALARADVGIAIGSGTDVAVESAGIVLVRSDPRDVVAILRLARASYRKMVENLLWATGYNVVALPLAAGVLAPWGILLGPALGAGLMSASTLIVAVNAQLLRRLPLGN